jgi:serine/threonine-protein kinase
MRVPASGGTPTPLANVNANGAAQKFPQALPGGRAVLYSEQRSDIELNAGDIVVAPVAGGAPKVVVQGGYYGRYMSSGHVLYVKNGTLFAVRFDLDRLEVIGSAVPVIEGVASGFTGNGGSQYAISNEGTLVYASGIGASDAKQIDWLTRDGKSTLLRSTRSSWSDARFSPDGTRLAFDILDDKGRRVWVYDWARDVATQLTFGPGEDSSPVWTPDGKRITFGSDRAKAGILSIYEVNADGTGVVTRLTDSPYKQRPWSWHPNGKVLAFYATRPETGHDLFMLTMDGDGANRRPGAVSVFQGLPTSEVAPNFSPDGRFVAFFSSQNNGIFDIYVRPLAGPGGPWRISTDGGLYPVWSAASHELLYVDPRRGLVMAAPYSIVGDSFQAGAPKIWSPTTVRSSGSWTAYDGFHLAVHPDGTRIATELATDELKALQDKLVFVFNFGDYLKKIVPGKR